MEWVNADSVAARSKTWVCGRLLAGIVGSNLAGDREVCLRWVFCVCVCVCVLSGRGLYVRLIIRPEESYRVWCIWVWQWSLNNEEEALALTWGCCAMEGKKTKIGVTRQFTSHLQAQTDSLSSLCTYSLKLPSIAKKRRVVRPNNNEVTRISTNNLRYYWSNCLEGLKKLTQNLRTVGAPAVRSTKPLQSTSVKHYHLRNIPRCTKLKSFLQNASL